MSDPVNCRGEGEQRCPHTEYGKNGTIPIGNPGEMGKIECKTGVNECLWIHEILPMVIDDLTRDLAKVGKVSQAMSYLKLYESALATCPEVSWSSVYLLQFQGLLYNLTQNLDGYGMKRNWVPGLSTEVTGALYMAELDLNIRLQFGFWQVIQAQNDRKAQKLYLTNLIAQSYQDLVNLRAEIDATVINVASLETEMDNVSGFLQQATEWISEQEKMLLEAAKKDAKKEAEVPGWMKFGRLAATVGQFIPIPQVAGAR